MSIASQDAGSVAPGRPREVEAPTNLYLVHPASHALAALLARTAVTPNQVSIASVFASGAAALAYIGMSWPWNAFVGLAFQFLWHVLDGADGELARRTGRASAFGELVDGVCDHLSQALIYIAFALFLQDRLGGWAWVAAAGAALSHFLQANAYETGRKAYRRCAYGAPWMRQTGAGVTGFGAALSRLYLGVSDLLSPGEASVERAMDGAISRGSPAIEAARAAYRKAFAPLVKLTGVLSSNTRTLAAFLSVLAGHPLWLFLFEISVLNLALAGFAIRRGSLNRAFASSLLKASP